VLYYDDLLVGTGNGFYGHKGLASSSSGIYFNENNLFSVFPNPVDNQFHIRSEFEMNKLQILDLLGNVVASFDHPLDNSLISVAGLQKGLYLLKVTNLNGSDAIMRIVKE
jgi:hypothetical protein